jgi:DNA-binding PucR family transcriptional regulator
LPPAGRQHPASVRTVDGSVIAALTRTAKRLTVHPNTIVYRLKRVHEVTRHESFEPEGLLLLALGLKLHRPGSPEAS